MHPNEQLYARLCPADVTEVKASKQIDLPSIAVT